MNTYKYLATVSNRFILIIFYSFFALNSLANGENKVVGAEQIGMGETSSTSQNVFSAHNNPAGIAYLNNVSFAIYMNRPFFVKDLNSLNLSAVIPIQKIGAFGVDINYFGYAAYNETRAGFSYARSFSDIVSLGIKFDYLRLAVKAHDSKNIFAFGVGLQYQPLKKLRIAAFVYNPISTVINNEKFATNFTLGLSYLASQKLTINIEGEKEINENIRFKTGVEYKPLKHLFLRIGAATNPTLLTFGLGTEFKNFKLDASASWHMKLGLTPQISLVYKIQKKTKSEL